MVDIIRTEVKTSAGNMNWNGSSVKSRNYLARMIAIEQPMAVPRIDAPRISASASNT